MKSIYLGLLFSGLIVTLASAQDQTNDNIWKVTPKYCTVYQDTIGLSLGDQLVVIIRYSYSDHDSIDSYIISKMPNTADLVGEDFFYNFAASLMVRSVLWSNMISKVIIGNYSNKPFKDFEPSKAIQFDSVWVEIEGIILNAMQEPNIQALATNHERIRSDKIDFNKNKDLDLFLIRNTNIKERPDGGWIHFSFRLIK